MYSPDFVARQTLAALGIRPTDGLVSEVLEAGDDARRIREAASRIALKHWGGVQNPDMGAPIRTLMESPGRFRLRA